MARRIVTPAHSGRRRGGRPTAARSRLHGAATPLVAPLLAAAALVVVGCQRAADEPAAQHGTAPPDSAVPVAPAEGAQANTAAGGQARTRIAVEAASAAARSPDSRVPEETLAAASGPPPALRATDTAPLMPEDFAIGPLQDTVAGAADQRAVAEIVVRFLRGLAAGEVPAELVDAAVRDDVRRSLEPELQQGLLPSSARVGVIDGEGEAAWANVRLFASGRVEGEIYLWRRAEGWWITDVQIDLNGLQLPYEGRGEAFFPSSYRWLLIN